MSYLSQNDIRITHLGIFIDSLEMRNEEFQTQNENVWDSFILQYNLWISTYDRGWWTNWFYASMTWCKFKKLATVPSTYLGM